MNALLLALASALNAIAPACNAYVAWVKWEKSKEIDNLEDEISACAAIGSAASELRMEQLSLRKQRKLESLKSL